MRSYKLPTTFKGRGRWGRLAQWMNRVGRIVNGIRGESGVSVFWAGDNLVIRGNGTGSVTRSGTTVIIARIQWNATAGAYDWAEQEWENDAAGDHWQDKVGGQYSAGITDWTGGTGTVATTLAKHHADLEQLPDGLIVRMEFRVDDTGVALYVFVLPVNGVEAGLAALGTGDGWTISDGETTKGCKVLVHSRIAYLDARPPKIQAFPRTILVDPSGVALAVSAEGTPDDVVTFEACTVVGSVQVSGNSLQYRLDTLYALKPTTGSWTNVSSGACP